ncbi:MAG TPA: MFS transporter [Streptosporangiaceae bacterium]|nr:MFS transporter [Streptosporangiaceae bacterium]
MTGEQMAPALRTLPDDALGPAETPATPLWRNLQFQTLWAGSAASSLGVSVADVAYPLAILALTGSPAKAGLFAAVLTVGMLAGALPAGQLADRQDRRTIVIAAESARAAVTAAVTVGLMLGWLSLPLLLAAAVLLGIGQAVAGAARLALVRSVVADNQLTAALVQDEVRQNGAALAGPPLAGWLYELGALSHAVPFLCTAAAFAFSTLSAVAMKVMPGGRRRSVAPAQTAENMPTSGPATAPVGRKPESDMFVGIRALWRAPVVRAAMLLIMIANMIGVGLDLVVIVILRHQHVAAGTIGLAIGAGAVGGLAGAPLVKVLHRLKPGVLLLGMGLYWIPVLALLALPFGPWWVAGLLFMTMLGVPALRVLLDVLIIRQTPDEQRGRTVAAVTMLISAGMPAGMAGTGLLLQWLPAQAAMLTLVGVLALGVGYCATKRELWRARWPH